MYIHAFQTHETTSSPVYEITKHMETKTEMRACIGAPAGIRTPNLLIRSQMLYPLSYGRKVKRFKV